MSGTGPAPGGPSQNNNAPPDSRFTGTPTKFRALHVELLTPVLRDPDNRNSTSHQWLDNHPNGFLLMRNVKRWAKMGETMLLHPLDDTEEMVVVKYIRQRRQRGSKIIYPASIRFSTLERDRYAEVRLPEEHFAKLYAYAFPTEKLPQPALTTSRTDTYALYYQHYNGGSLRSLLEMYGDPEIGAPVPEPFIWHVAEQLSRAVLYLQRGIQPGELDEWLDEIVAQRRGDKSSNKNADNNPEEIADDLIGDPIPPDTWQPIVHRSITPKNILLHFDDPNANIWAPWFPKIVLKGLESAIQLLPREEGDEVLHVDNEVPPEAWLDSCAIGKILRRLAINHSNNIYESSRGQVVGEWHGPIKTWHPATLVEEGTFSNTAEAAYSSELIGLLEQFEVVIDRSLTEDNPPRQERAFPTTPPHEFLLKQVLPLARQKIDEFKNGNMPRGESTHSWARVSWVQPDPQFEFMPYSPIEKREDLAWKEVLQELKAGDGKEKMALWRRDNLVNVPGRWTMVWYEYGDGTYADDIGNEADNGPDDDMWDFNDYAPDDCFVADFFGSDEEEQDDDDDGDGNEDDNEYEGDNENRNDDNDKGNNNEGKRKNKRQKKGKDKEKEKQDDQQLPPGLQQSQPEEQQEHEGLQQPQTQEQQKHEGLQRPEPEEQQEHEGLATPQLAEDHEGLRAPDHDLGDERQEQQPQGEQGEEQQLQKQQQELISDEEIQKLLAELRRELQHEQAQMQEGGEAEEGGKEQEDEASTRHRKQLIAVLLQLLQREGLQLPQSQGLEPPVSEGLRAPESPQGLIKPGESPEKLQKMKLRELQRVVNMISERKGTAGEEEVGQGEEEEPEEGDEPSDAQQAAGNILKRIVTGLKNRRKRQAFQELLQGLLEKEHEEKEVEQEKEAEQEKDGTGETPGLTAVTEEYGEGLTASMAVTRSQTLASRPQKRPTEDLQPSRPNKVPKKQPAKAASKTPKRQPARCAKPRPEANPSKASIGPAKSAHKRKSNPTKAKVTAKKPRAAKYLSRKQLQKESYGSSEDWISDDASEGWSSEEYNNEGSTDSSSSSSTSGSTTSGTDSIPRYIPFNPSGGSSNVIQGPLTRLHKQVRQRSSKAKRPATSYNADSTRGTAAAYPGDELRLRNDPTLNQYQSTKRDALPLRVRRGLWSNLDVDTDITPSASEREWEVILEPNSAEEDESSTSTGELSYSDSGEEEEEEDSFESSSEDRSYSV
ncbi:hypothetical protein VTJ04DRAFT_10817 [Mycothermus thermophilus]|uniref:uncharacterized protein n=1 Tax=Humicola insolens TaxID=85995 RepID=UPI003744972C